MKRPTPFERMVRAIVIILAAVVMFEIVTRISEQISPLNRNEGEVPRQNSDIHSMGDAPNHEYPS